MSELRSGLQAGDSSKLRENADALPRPDEDERREWVIAVANTLAELPGRPGDSSPKADETARVSPTTWRQSDVSLTGTRGPGGSEASSEAVDRFFFRLDAGGYGKLGFTVQHGTDGVRVAIDAKNPVAAAALDIEAGALLEALRQAGLRVHSVTVSTGRTGTTLARSDSGTHDRNAETSLAYRRVAQDDERKRKVDLVG